MQGNAASIAAGAINEDLSVTVHQAELFTVGLVTQLLQSNNQAQLEKCIKGADDVTHDVAVIASEFK